MKNLNRFIVVTCLAVTCLSFKVPVLVFGIGVGITALIIFILDAKSISLRP